ncbi:hypothetical protein BV360_03784 [Pseudomonas syringae pv. actinidiae]|uniref:Stage V sporulation protein SpoVR/YcgB n=2 Tax=Pseudomonas syringae group TaxID=136849 RepID=A0A2V0QA94_PSESF|nr:hypothetical protein AN901_204915 [Pseudomonas syringae pv. theae]OSN15959.1 hypothetical protein BV340_03672 [Pseudomonas syringae pv. actinidiae]SOS34265.1 hypothetical protein CFBP6411_02908 [Pseudomonas syringae group genomosp. 3]OSN16794.1 hypothetical protein BV339_03749 [Pseudomonas syringae pv. actinidiae]OSN25119.1 hypothetical protein BV341_03734 [Pseudomonas syringae pv. actinidiae]
MCIDYNGVRVERQILRSTLTDTFLHCGLKCKHRSIAHRLASAQRKRRR